MDILGVIHDSMVILQQPILLLYVAGGVFFGMYAGAIPGISVTMAASLLISLTYSWNTLPAIAAIVGVHVGGVYGGSRSAILLNVPGTPASLATTFDGYPMAQKGLAAQALGITAVQSVVGGLIGAMILLFSTPLVVNFALLFAPRDYFLLSLMGIFLLSSMSGKSFAKGIFCGGLGMLIGTIGMDQATAVPRFTFGSIHLMSGVSSVAIMIGMFGLSESLVQLRDLSKVVVIRQNVDKIVPKFKDILKYFPLTLRCSFIGAFIGALPGTGGNIAALISYDHAKKSVRNPEVPFGEGAIEGLVAPESSNNAAVGGSYIPMLTLGIPGDSVTAIVIAALFIHGITPGPLLMSDTSGAFGAIVGAVIVANIVLLPVSLTGIKAFAKIAETPKPVLLPLIIVLAVVGAYSLNHSITDVYWMFGFGILGYFLKIHDFQIGPIILGVILSSLLELNLRRAIEMSRSDFILFFKQIFTSPLSFVLFFMIIGMVAMQFNIIDKIKSKLKKTA